MRATTLLIVLSLFIQTTLSAQSCLPEGITFTTQEQIDNFQTDYPNCTEIEGDVKIAGDDITSLNGLSNLTSIGEDLTIWYNYSLTSMVGLEGLTSIGEDLVIRRNDILGGLSGLQNLTSIGGSLLIGGYGAGDHFRYYGNPSLLDISDLDNVSSIGNSIEIVGNFSLESLTGLENITSLNNLTIAANDSLTTLSGINNLATLDGYLLIGYSMGGIKGNKSLITLSALENLISIGEGLQIMGNDALTSLTGLENLTSTGSDLAVLSNAILTSLTGLDNIDAGTIENLYIYENGSLVSCEVQSVCEYLVDSNGTVEIHDNAPGCNSQLEVEEACETVSIEEISLAGDITASPNPFTTSTTIQYTINSPRTVTFTFYNQFGKPVDWIEQKQSTGKQQITWNAEGLPAGIYYFRLNAGQQSANGKIVLIR